jgi:hypothetical protein
MTEHRSFPEAGNGLPALSMEAELWAAGCDRETARFVARQLAADGYTLVRASHTDCAEREGPSNSLTTQLGALARVAEASDHWTGEERLMPAAGVADLIYEALDELEAKEKTPDR